MTDARAGEFERNLRRTWQRPPGIYGWLSQVNHKAIGSRFIATALFFFLIAGVNALLMRMQLATPLADVLSPDTYN